LSFEALGVALDVVARAALGFAGAALGAGFVFAGAALETGFALVFTAAAFALGA